MPGTLVRVEKNKAKRSFGTSAGYKRMGGQMGGMGGGGVGNFPSVSLAQEKRGNETECKRVEKSH